MRRVGISWSVVAIAALALVTGVLALAALHSSGSAANVTPLPTASALGNPGGPDTNKTKAKNDTVPDVEPPLSMVDPSLAYRATVGTCLGGSTVEMTQDGGLSWVKWRSPVTALTSIRGQTTAVATVIGGDRKCDAGSWTAASGGNSWSGPHPTTGLWFRLPQTTRKIATPTGSQLNPCPNKDTAVREIIGLDAENGVLLCANGSIQTSVDGGLNWVPTTVIADAEALAWTDPTTGYLLRANSALCPAFLLEHTIDGGANWGPGGCVGVEADVASQTVAPSLDFADTQNGMATVDGGTYLTTDAGLNWQKAHR